MKPSILRLLGHSVHQTARIRPSLILVDRLAIGPKARIGFGNIIACRRIVMRKAAYFHLLNVARGKFSIALGENAAIGNRNNINDGPKPRPFRPAVLRLGVWSKITSNHLINCYEDIVFGDYSTLAGRASQIWTHGYVHYPEGLDRAVVLGKVRIGSNVYIGSMSCINPGLTIGDRIAVGAHSSIATSLRLPGVYVSQPLRYVPRVGSERLTKLQRFHGSTAGPEVYWRDGGGSLVTTRTADVAGRTRR